MLSANQKFAASRVRYSVQSSEVASTSKSVLPPCRQLDHPDAARDGCSSCVMRV